MTNEACFTLICRRSEAEEEGGTVFENLQFVERLPQDYESPKQARHRVSRLSTASEPTGLG